MRVWTYHDAVGVPVGQVRRKELPDGEKEIRPWVPDGSGGWTKGAMPTPRPLYRLPELLAAPAVLPVLVVEGEKAAGAAQAALAHLRVIVTTWAGGSGAVHSADWAPLAGRTVCIWPDHDEPGDKAAAEIMACALQAGARALWLLEPDATWPKGHDAADLEPDAVEDIWTCGRRWLGGDVDPGRLRRLLELAEAPRSAPRPPDRPRQGAGLDLNLDRARAVPILDVAARVGIEHRRGWARCPFHADSSPSLHLNARKQRAFCNPCGRSWDAIELYRDVRGLDFVQAVRELAA
jgi:hypothetical protein